MVVKFIKSGIYVLMICSFYPILTFAQKGAVTTINQPFRSANIIIDRFEWAFDDSLKTTTEAKITISNKSELAVKSVTLLLTGQTKTGITLQSGSTHTLKRKTASEKIMPEETKTIVMSRAFNNSQLYTLMLKEITIEYENGSLEVLK